MLNTVLNTLAEIGKSIVFAIIVLNKGVPQAKFMAMVVVLTVFLSLVAHGISANPLAKLLGNNTDAKED